MKWPRISTFASPRLPVKSRIVIKENKANSINLVTRMIRRRRNGKRRDTMPSIKARHLIILGNFLAGDVDRKLRVGERRATLQLSCYIVSSRNLRVIQRNSPTFDIETKLFSGTRNFIAQPTLHHVDRFTLPREITHEKSTSSPAIIVMAPVIKSISITFQLGRCSPGYR